MNSHEFEALTGKLSNAARVVYCLYLRPHVDTVTSVCPPLNYKALLALINTQDNPITLGRQLNALIDELMDAGLVLLLDEVPGDQSYNGLPLTLPLLNSQNQDFQSLHNNWQPMNKAWQPTSELYSELCQLIGIIDREYQEVELGEFIAYWLGRPDVLKSTYQWNQAFVFHIKKKRTAYGITTSTQQVGQQKVSKKSGVKADKKAQQLVEKYRGKH